MATPLTAVLAPPPTRTPVAGKDGLLSAAWVMYFQKLNDRVGGPVSQTLTQVASDVTTVQGEVATLTTDVDTLQATVATQEGEIGALQATVATQEAEITALQAILAPGISIVITTAALTLVGLQGSMTFVNGVLTAQTQAT